jgi:hypothetical protein
MDRALFGLGLELGLLDHVQDVGDVLDARGLLVDQHVVDESEDQLLAFDGVDRLAHHFGWLHAGGDVGRVLVENVDVVLGDLAEARLNRCTIEVDLVRVSRLRSVRRGGADRDL